MRPRIPIPRLSVVLLAACLLLAGILVAPRSLTPSAQAATGGESDDFLEVEDIAVSFVTAPLDGVGARRLANGIALPNQPEMLIIDTSGRLADFSLRSQSADGAWSEWLDVSTPTDESPDGLGGEEGAGSSVGAIGPIWIGDNALAVEMMQTGGDATEVVVQSINSTDTRPALQTANSGADLQAAALGTGRPAIMPRSAWATDGWKSGNSGCGSGPSYAKNVRTIVVHHTVTTNSYESSQVDDILRAIYRLHAETNGWCDIAYNFLVDRFGTIWEGRTGGVDEPVIGGHAKGFNTWTVGVALLGQHQEGASPAAVAPSAESIAAVESIAAWKLALHGIDPLGTSWLKNRSDQPPMRFASGEFVEMPAIIGHRDLGQTSCPGSLTIPSVAPMRTALAPSHNASSPPIPAGRQAEPGPALMVTDNVGGLRAAVAALPAASPAYAGDVIAIAGKGKGGQLLLSTGSLIPFGEATATSGQPAGSRRAVDVVAGAHSSQGWVLEEDGRIYRFGGTPDSTAPVKPAPGQAVALALLENGRGYILDQAGRLFAVDGAPERSIGAPVAAVDVALRPDGVSGWVLDAGGRLSAFGGAPDWQPEQAVANPRAVVVGGNYGGWVLDAEGRLIRFGNERRANPVSSTVGQADIVDVALLGWDYGEQTEDVKLASALLGLFLREPPDRALADHYGFLLDDTSTGDVIAELSQSEAWAGKLIDEMYNDVLGRLPDGSGRTYWLDQIRRGLRTQDLGALFYGSEEYVRSSGTTSAYVQRLYAELLGRAPDGPGLAFWISRLDSGRSSPPDVTIGFYQSPESRGQRVLGLYREILGRDPDPAGAAYWADQLLRFDDIALAQELAGSREFRNNVLN